MGACWRDVYRRTDGNPVEAAAALVAELREMSDAPVVAIGITGSGRDAAATVVRAAFPDIGGRLCVQNEIVAHATAAVRYDPGGGRSLSIVEIGGQDAKFINVRNGRVVDSDMNRVCSAGTGSFLEEQAEAFGVRDIAGFGELAARSARPPDLGRTCTVFVGDVAAEALNQGFSREDVFAGLQFSVMRNYCSRVMGQRRFLDSVMFQGKPASSASLARTLAAVTERTVSVPPNPGAMGAIGIAMLAAEALQVGGLRARRAAARPGASAARAHHGPQGVPLPRPLVRQSLPRGDGHRGRGRRAAQGHQRRHLPQVRGGRRRSASCPRGRRDRSTSARSCWRGCWAGRRAGRRGDERRGCRRRGGRLAGLAGREAGADAPHGPLVGLPYCHYLVDSLPFFHAFFTGLGARVQVIRSTPTSLAEGDRRCAAAGSCAPVKIAHALTGAHVDALFLPKLVNVPYPGAGPGASTCPMTQGTPEMVEAALRAEGDRTPVLRPVLFRDRRSAAGVARAGRRAGGGGRRPGEAHGRRLDSQCAFPPAFRAAVEAQRAFEEGLAAIGERALRAARRGRRAGGADGRRDPRAARAAAEPRHPRPGGRQRRHPAAGGLLRGGARRAAAGAGALGERGAPAARQRGRGAPRRGVPDARRRLRLRAELVRRAPVQRPLRGVPAHGAGDGRTRRHGRLRDPRAGLPALRACVQG